MEEGESVWITSTIMAGPVVSLAQQGGFPALKGNQALLGRQEPPALKGNPVSYTHLSFWSFGPGQFWFVPEQG